MLFGLYKGHVRKGEWIQIKREKEIETFATDVVFGKEIQIVALQSELNGTSVTSCFHSSRLEALLFLAVLEMHIHPDPASIAW